MICIQFECSYHHLSLLPVTPLFLSTHFNASTQILEEILRPKSYWDFNYRAPAFSQRIYHIRCIALFGLLSLQPVPSGYHLAVAGLRRHWGSGGASPSPRTYNFPSTTFLPRLFPSALTLKAIIFGKSVSKIFECCLVFFALTPQIHNELSTFAHLQRSCNLRPLLSKYESGGVH